MNPQHKVCGSENEGSDCMRESPSGDDSEEVEVLSDASNNRVENKVTDSLPTKHGSYNDLPASKLSELMKLSSLQTASTLSLLNVVKTILDENIEKTNASIPMRVASLLKFTMQEIEQRVSKESENTRKQNSLNKSREERYYSKIKALETLAAGTTEENKIITGQLQQKKVEHQDMIRLLEENEKKYQIEKAKIEEEKKVEHQDMIRLLEEKEKTYQIEKARIEEEKKVEHQDMIRLLEEKEMKFQIEKAKIEEEKKVEHRDMIKLLEEKEKKYQIEKARIEEEKNVEHENMIRLLEEKEKKYEIRISSLKKELELTKQTNEENVLHLKSQYNETIAKMERKRMELERKVKELEDLSESKYERLKKKQLGYEHFMDSHIGSIQDLRKASESIKQDMLKTKKFYFEELHHFELETKELVNAAQNYHNILEENRRLYNEVQDLKGNIRVYCRVRPFLPGQSTKKTTVDYIGENGELVVANPLKQGKDTHRMFKFDKVFGPATTQEDVFRDTQPLIRSVLDGYNVCIFAYGQTGSGKTYTMTGPSSSSVENWGVNYRALNDLFNISQTRKSSITYEVGVQMVEIYNEQVRDLLVNGSSQKRLGIWNSTQPNGLAVPDASMHGVKSTADVLELMNVGLKNRAMSATALNERSSRSHSVLTVHVQGTDLKTNDVMRGNLHLVDLAGSERVDRSEVTGDRLKEAQHINKSLSALGDVIFALAQKSHHVPYRNSKLTQVLQSSLGGQAKTLMFVQLNPEVESYSESVSTLKFAERVSGVELGAARSNKEGRGVRELMEQVGLLKDTISQKDQEIGRLRQVKTKSNGEKRVTSLTRYGPPPSSRRHSLGGAHPLRRTSSEQSSRPIEKQVSDLEVISDCSDKHSEAGSQQSTEELKLHQEFFQHSRLESRSPWADQNVNLDDDIDLLRFDEGDDDERLSDISDSVLSLGTGNETDGSNSIVEYTLFPETPKPPTESSEKPSVSHKLPRPSQKPVLSGNSHPPLNKTSSKIPSSKKTNIGSSSAVRSSKRWL